MDIIYWCIGVAWVVGGIAEIAKTNATLDSNNIEKPYYGAFFVMWVLLFFTWPYWYFYRK